MSTHTPQSWLWGTWSRFGLAVALATIAIDQCHKLWMLMIYQIQDKGRISVLPFLDLVYVKNLGISYGLGAGHLGQPLLAMFAIAAAIVLTIWLARGATGRIMAGSIGLIIGGAIGNAIDRLHLGGVADFFSLHAFGYYWYVFNVADVAIVAGVLGLLYDSFGASRGNAANAP
ncbi:MAG: signal peptidase II [Hyphomicrobiaceae bacterium]